ncbi:mucin-3A-like isoform X2 [Carassius carassius]|uniref:mucin-3A-like isoform X2 n=1 Tax=Carassius carassius TaxID=217509 RepID=UPI00286868DA|nr:mucin-3A-like isoform X2 [Carassius carassius]
MFTATTETEPTTTVQSSFTTATSPMPTSTLESPTSESGSTVQTTMYTTGTSPSSPFTSTEGQRTSDLTSTEISSSTVEQTTSQLVQTTLFSSTIETEPTMTAQSTFTTPMSPITTTTFDSSTSEKSSTVESTSSSIGTSPFSMSIMTEGQRTSELPSTRTEIFSSAIKETTVQQSESTRFTSTTESEPKTAAVSVFTTAFTPISPSTLESSTNESGSTAETILSTTGTSQFSPSTITDGQITSGFTLSIHTLSSSVEQTSQQTQTTQFPPTTETDSMSTSTLESSTLESGSTLETAISTSKSSASPPPLSTTKGQTTSKLTSSITEISSSSIEQSTRQQTQSTQFTSTTETESTMTGQSAFTTAMSPMSTTLRSSTLESSSTVETTLPTIGSTLSSLFTTTEGQTSHNPQTITSAVTAQTFSISTSSQPSPSAETSTQKTSSISTEPHSSATTLISVSTTQSCLENCLEKCNGSPCIFNVTSGECQCQCNPFTFGENCNFVNDSSSITWSESRPTRNANVSLRIMMDYLPGYENVNSSESKKLISILKHELSILCKRADAPNFKDVHIHKLVRGSVIAESTAVYNYPNNDSQIMFLNNYLEYTLETIFNDTDSLKNLSIALNASIQVDQITMGPVIISNVSDLQSFVKCAVDFANLTVEMEDGAWVCTGSCKNNSAFCNQRGVCLNQKNGPQCRCYSSPFEKYHGDHCELYSRGAGFYAVLFGCLAAFALLIIVFGVMILVLYRAKRTSSKRRLSLFDDVFFDFTSRGSIDSDYGIQNLSVTEDSAPGSFSSYHENTPVR